MAMTIVSHSLQSPQHQFSPTPSTGIPRPRCHRPSSIQRCSFPPSTSKRSANSSVPMLPSSSFNPLRRGPHHRYDALPRAASEGGEGREGADASLNHGVEIGVEPFDWIPTFIAFLFPALGGALFGYDIGATSGALVSLTSAELSGIEWYRLTAVETGLVVSGSLYGALIGSILAFKVSDAFGRRKELIAAACLYSVGAVTMLSAPSLTVLLIGRLVYGLGIGLAMHGAPLYIAETCPPQIRGTLVSLKEAFIVLGILGGYLVGNLEIGEVGGWRAMYGFSAPVGLVMAAGMWWLPPSPRWLLLRQGKSNLQQAKEKAVSALLRLRNGRLNNEAAEAIIKNSLISLQSSEAQGREPTFSEVFQGSSLKALKIGAGLVFFQQITGQPSVLYYAASILQSAGFSAAADATRVSIIIGIFKLFMTAVAVFKVDDLGRRPLLIGGVGGLVLSLFLLAAYYSFGQGYPIVAVVSLLLYVSCYQISFGPISWLMVSEIFPLRTRGRALSIAVLTNFASNALVTFAFAPIQELLGTTMTFVGFGLVGVVALLFIVTSVPETKGLSLEEIESKLLEK